MWADTWVRSDAYLPTQKRTIMWVWWTEGLCVLPTPQFVGWNLILNVMVFGSGAFGRWLGHKGRPSWMGLVLLEEEDRELAHSFYHMRTQKEDV